MFLYWEKIRRAEKLEEERKKDDLFWAHEFRICDEN